MFASIASRTLILSLVGLTLACGPDSDDSATDTGDSGAATEVTTGATDPTTGATDPTTGATDPTTGATDPTTGATDGMDTDTDTTGAPVFPMCQEPEGPDNVGFEISGKSLALGGDIDMICMVMSGDTAPDFTASIALTCLDAMGLQQDFTIDLGLFYEPNIGVFNGAPQVRLLYSRIDSFDPREVLAVRGVEDDSLLLFAARGYDIFKVEDPALWAPLGVSPVAQVLCATEGEGDCDTATRSALDITLGEVTERVFDRDWIKFGSPGLSVHVGLAQIIDHDGADDCFPGDAPQGLETTLVVISEK